MNQLAPLPAPAPALALPALIAAADERAQLRFLEFFAVTIRNPHTRRAYARAAGDFLAWCEARGVASLAQSYDLVVIDAGAVLDDESATALMPVADQIVLVSRQGGPSAQADRELQRMIAPYRESVVGTLVNMHS